MNYNTVPLQLKTDPNYILSNAQKKDLIENIKRGLSDYFRSSPYPMEVIGEILDEDFIASNPSYYLYYPYLFRNYFQVKDKETIDLLSISGFLYYKAIILIDDIFDNKNSKDNFQKFFIANICQEETIKILSSFFSASSEFWKIWNVRKLEYAKAYKLDKNPDGIREFSDFEVLADYKSAFGKVAIDCLFHLSEKKNKLVYTALLDSHKSFYVAFQIMDDIMDYTEDFKNGQSNISRQELAKALHGENDSIENYTLEEQKKLVYLKGVAENLYDKATKYLDRSLECQSGLKDNGSQLWVNEINSLYNTGVNHFLNIRGFINVYDSEKRLSQELQGKKGISETIESAIKYLDSGQLPDGAWNDIFNDAGVSDIWATSYVTYLLDGIIPKAKMDLAKKFIVKNQIPNSLWGYNKAWIIDADSSSFALLSLKEEKTIKSYVEKWLAFQNEDGGFATYNDKDILLSSLNSSHIQNVDGWLQSHFCVSAVAFLVFVELDMTSQEEFGRLRGYLVKKLNSNDESLSYWWSNDIYAIYFVLLGAVKLDDLEIIRLCENRLENLIEREADLDYFYKGFLLSILCLTDNLFLKHTKQVKSLVGQILSNQFMDGSWQESYALKMPHPSIPNSSSGNFDCKKGNKGTNIITKDYNRIFTTVSCLKALKSYGSKI